MNWKVILLLLICVPIFAQDKIERNLGDFTKVKSYRGLQIELIKSDQPKIIIDGNKSSHVTVKNDNGTLKISMDLTGTFNSDDVMVYLYYTKDLDLLDANEGSMIYSDQKITQDRLEARAQEGARIKLEFEGRKLEVMSNTGAYVNMKGSVEDQDVKVNTGGIYKGERLTAQNTEVNAATGGNAEVFAVKSVDAKANTAGIIKVHGDPEQVSSSESTGGKIKD